MRFEDKKLKEFILTSDILNTINGGMSLPIVKVKENWEGYNIHVEVPGVKKESFRVEINDNLLSIYHIIDLPVSLYNEMGISVPNIIRNVSIPYNVDIKRISATYEDGALNVLMPFNELANGYQKSVGIT